MPKSPDAFRTISEVAEDLDLPQHVLRFWETRFSQIKPMKRGGGRRYYRPDDVDLLRGIQFLLYEEGYTIKGVQRILKENGNKYVIAAGRGEDLSVFDTTPARASAQAPEPAAASDKADSKIAVPVAQVMAGEDKPVKNKGLLNRLVGKDDNTPPAPGTLNLSADERKLLQTALYDLLECKRLLDQAR